jgi:hypothetical protein
MRPAVSLAACHISFARNIPGVRSDGRQAAPAPQAPRAAPKAGTPPQEAEKLAVAALAPIVVPAVWSPPSPAPEPQATTAADDFPTGWELRKESWHFHRRFFAIFRRPMQHGEYSHLLWQIRRRKAEHLWEDCWRVTLPDRRRPCH